MYHFVVGRSYHSNAVSTIPSADKFQHGRAAQVAALRLSDITAL
jgi:hypothetical protein